MQRVGTAVAVQTGSRRGIFLRENRRKADYDIYQSKYQLEPGTSRVPGASRNRSWRFGPNLRQQAVGQDAVELLKGLDLLGLAEKQTERRHSRYRRYPDETRAMRLALQDLSGGVKGRRMKILLEAETERDVQVRASLHRPMYISD